jgi:hypothetical protein
MTTAIGGGFLSLNKFFRIITMKAKLFMMETAILMFFTVLLVVCNDNKPIHEFEISNPKQIEVFDTSLVPDDYTGEDLLMGYKTLYES